MSNLTDENIIKISNKYKIEPEAVKAVIAVESSGYGFYNKFILDRNKKPLLDKEGLKILNPYGEELIVRFEGHHFRRYTKNKFNNSHPTLSFYNWKLGYKYNKGQLEFGRFLDAFRLDGEAAWLSTSWGLFQIMGFNYKACGYSSVKEMILDFYHGGEIAQLEAFFNFCESKRILDDLQRLDFAGFARIYNGSGYKKNKYDIKMLNIYNKLKN
jgi:hypothetical protein